jgi:hypothetical protein
MNDEKVRVEPDTLEIVWEASCPTDETIPVTWWTWDMPVITSYINVH